ncbi:MAG: hypothetical protein RLZ84_15 [Actinomycetota bacterium]|jgi:N-acyl-D-aspartate/D-glutamate deacylase
MFDLIIRSGSVIDGTGRAAFVADIAIRDGKIAAIAPHIDGEARETIDATGYIVTPGFVDVHTHYDGQVSWDSLLDPSSSNGVTTVVVGNCGVGFAPVQKGKEAWLVQLMEGVEDIPGTALHEGITWEWETFPEYLDAIGRRTYAVDVAAYVPHGAVRGYVMGERGARNEKATDDDLREMSRIVQEAREAGAVGFSTSRTMAHKARDGEPVPGTFADMDEMNAIARALEAGGGGIFEIAPEVLPADADGAGGFMSELGWMREMALATELKVSYLLLQNSQTPTIWRDALDFSQKTLDDGGYLRPQVAARPFGMMIGWASYNPFLKRPTFMDLSSRLSGDELRQQLATPAVRARILSEADVAPDPTVPFDGIGGLFQMVLDRIYVMGEDVDYEPLPDRTVAAAAKRLGVNPLEMAYDLMNESNGNSFLMFPFFNYVDGNHDAIYDMLTHPAAISGLGDGGAHVRMICDASMTTYMLTHWARDRRRGSRIALEEAVRLQTSATADFAGFSDRGVLAVGKRADINIIDFENLRIHFPHAQNDLPAGGTRLLQMASGYKATIVNGEVTRRDGRDTGARPGRLVRA